MTGDSELSKHVRQAYRSRPHLMPASALPPAILSRAADFIEAFDECSTERQVGGMVPGPIPRSAIVAYARDMGYRGVERSDLLEVVRIMDGWWLSRLSERSKRS